MTEPHSHHHSHASEYSGQSDWRLVCAILVNVLLTIVQIIGGALSGSLSLVADALHNFSDAGSLVVALVARRIGRRPPDRFQTFGYRRVEIVGALINATTLALIGIYLFYEAIMRFITPQEIEGWTVVIVAAVAFVVDAITAFLTYSMSKGNLNVKAAFVHNLTDAFGSIAVMIAGALIILYDLHIADVIATAMIAGYALHQGISMTRESSRILTLAVPLDVDMGKLMEELKEVDGVRDVSHAHLWALDETLRSLEAHIVVENHDLNLADLVKKKVRKVLRNHDILHSTLEIEFEVTDSPCESHRT